ncbi:MAG: PEP-utilizing enzyme, partial [Planctomycetota bacterium]|nr:PEP-utilizing enzyme [Planctomycetota bacterium]
SARRAIPGGPPMDPDRPLLIPLDAPGVPDNQMVGGKAAKLTQLMRAGFQVPRGFCLTTWAYEAFVIDAKITAAIDMELGRKSMDDMRWEEIWDTALRIRSMFLAQPLSGLLRKTVEKGLELFNSSTPLAVRSSAIGEDSAGHSFAGLHESIIGVRGERAVEDAVRLVWASLWSDAALLYRQELGLDPARSRMAVVVQEMVNSDRSGVAFARDPRDMRKDHAIIESVPGPCSLLVDGLVDPDRWEMNRATRGVVAWLPGQREDSDNKPLLEPQDLQTILQTLLSVEQLFRWSPDMEWTGRSDSLTVLQARPIATAVPDEDEKRSWYLTLRPNDARLKELRQRITGQLIPELAAAGETFAAEQLELLGNHQLADAIEKRSQTLARWKKIYWDEFIPFAHGVRRLATYYNDAVQPDDPYEFVGLLRNQPLLAAQRNIAISELAQQLGSNHAVRTAVEELLAKHANSLQWSIFRDELLERERATEGFVQRFDDLQERFLDVTFDNERVRDRPGPLLSNLVELSRHSNSCADHRISLINSPAELEEKLLAAVGAERRAEAMDVIETGRVSWRLRDDDNLLVARLDSQYLRALDVAAKRLRELGKLTGDGHIDDSYLARLVCGLREPSTDLITVEDSIKSDVPRLSVRPPGQTPRQLIGQPASPGLATGVVRRVSGRDDLGKFRKGEILVCDAIQPTMTHLVPLASGIVERRGGMLIHGAIIARELGIPCVNGVRDAAEILKNGDLVTVDGHLGIVTVGAADFDLEMQVEGV